jgi:SAM-dependent methyltransferase
MSTGSGMDSQAGLHLETPASGRSFSTEAFDRAYRQIIVGGKFQENSEYYLRYRSRYQQVIRDLGARLPNRPLNIMEVGGGQHPLLCKALWGDRAFLADLPGAHQDYVRSQGGACAEWNLGRTDAPFAEKMDCIFLCEVMPHIPIPPHIYLAKLREFLNPGGILLITTPNLFRLRNLIYMLRGKNFWGPFAIPEPGQWLGAFIDFTDEHLRYQLDRAGFHDIDVQLREFGHRATGLGGRIFNAVMKPFTWIPRYRYNLLAFARA